MERSREAGALPHLDAEGLKVAKEKFLEEVHAPSQRHVVKAKLQTIEKALAMWGLEPFPPTVEKVQALGSALKADRYKSAESHFSIYKAESERRDLAWTATVQRVMKDAVRSCQRGLGGPQRALPLPFARLDELPGGVDPWVGGGPLSPRNLVVLGSWFMLREVEAANARIADVAIVVKDGCPRVTWSLPASKTDQRAAGATEGNQPSEGLTSLGVWTFAGLGSGPSKVYRGPMVAFARDRPDHRAQHMLRGLTRRC